VLIHRGAQIVNEQVGVGSGRHADVAVAHEALDAVDVDAPAEQLVAKVWRRSWKRIFSGIAFGQSSRPRTFFVGLPVPSVRFTQCGQ
jgi:hypothetical protein